jgi:hypothetical protein
MIKSIRNHGFSLTFDNGYTVQVMYGANDACSRNINKRKDEYEDTLVEGTVVTTETAEVTVYDNKARAIIFDNDVSLKYQTPKQVADIIFRASIAKIPTDLHDFDLSAIHKKEDWE